MDIEKRKRGRPRKYHTEEERIAAIKANNKRWWATHPRAFLQKRKERAKANAVADPERTRKYRIEYALRSRRRDPLKFMISRKKHGAKQKGIEFNLKPSDFSMIPDTCPVLGIPITPFADPFDPNLASFDRVNPAKGYVKSNVKIISWKANRLKCNCIEPETFRAIADYIEKCNAENT